MKKKRFYFLPKTKIGKISFWIVLACFIGVYVQYWLSISGVLNLQLPISGFLLMIGIIACGITSFVAIIKHRDFAISLFITSLIGILGILFAIAEVLYPH